MKTTIQSCELENETGVNCAFYQSFPGLWIQDKAAEANIGEIISSIQQVAEQVYRFKYNLIGLFDNFWKYHRRSINYTESVNTQHFVS